MGSYDKAHLFPLLDEPLFFEAGKSPFLFDLMGIPSAIAICYDIRYPEFMRSLALTGAELIVVPAEWPTARIDHWETLLRARAIENQAVSYTHLQVHEHAPDPGLAKAEASTYKKTGGEWNADQPERKKFSHP